MPLLVAAVLAGCASSTLKAPVEDRGTTGKTVTSTPASEAPKPPPGIENAGKPGYYTVKQGDTLIRIGLDTGQNWRDIQRWNNLDNANLIEVGQVLRVVPPGIDPTVAAARPIASARVEPRPLDKPASGAATGPTPAAGSSPAASTAPTPAASPAGPASAAPPAPPAPPTAPAPAPAAPVREGDDELNWMWPAQGTMLSTFDETRNKGVSIAGKAGDPVVAAADGRVVYAGSGLRGYGNLVIIKHNETFLTAYAHNQTLLVKEDQPVRRGQKIAEMGSTDADRVQLHFEVRRRGRPIDPARLLPQR